MSNMRLNKVERNLSLAKENSGLSKVLVNG